MGEIIGCFYFAWMIATADNQISPFRVPGDGVYSMSIIDNNRLLIEDKIGRVIVNLVFRNRKPENSFFVRRIPALAYFLNYCSSDRKNLSLGVLDNFSDSCLFMAGEKFLRGKRKGGRSRIKA